MTVELLVPYDPTGLSLADELDYAAEVLAIEVVPPDPIPDDPDTPFVPPPPAKLGLELSLLLCRSGSHRKVVEIGTADIEGWDDPLSIRDPSKIRASASLWDPCWQEIGASWATIGDRFVVDVDWRAFELLLCVNGVPVQAGFLDDPVSIGDDRISLDASGPASALRGTMGDAGTSDQLGGAGSFSSAGGDARAWLTANGWQVPSDIEVQWNSTDPLSAPLSLQFRGLSDNVLRGPVVPVTGDSHYRRELRTSAVIRHSEGQVITVTEVYTSGSTQIHQGWSQRDAGASDESNDNWQQIASKGTLNRDDTVQFIRSAYRLYDTGTSWVDIDEVRYPLDGYTGSRTKVDLAAYPGRIMRRVQAQGNPDGQSLGIAVHSAVPTGVLESFVWPDFSDVSIIDALGQVMDRHDGPEVWFDAAWTMWVGPRRGRNRTDVVLSNDTVLQPAWTSDPRAIVDQLRVLTPFGTDQTRIGFAFDTPRPVGQRINRQIVQAPSELTYEQTRAWGAYEAERASRTQRYADLTVSYGYGSQISTGDGVWVALSAGYHGWWGWVRVANRTFDVKARTCTLTVGLDPTLTPVGEPGA